MGIVLEHNSKLQDALSCYKKSLKIKFNLYGESHEEVLELQYKIASIFMQLKQVKY
jgi:hypothetical protein